MVLCGFYLFLIVLFLLGYGGYDDYNGYNDGYGFGSDRFGRGKVRIEFPTKGCLHSFPSRPQLLFFRDV